MSGKEYSIESVDSLFVSEYICHLDTVEERSLYKMSHSYKTFTFPTSVFFSVSHKCYFLKWLKGILLKRCRWG